MSLKKGAMYVFIANVINLIISLFTGFVLPKYLSIETYSSIKLFQLYITYIGILHLGFSDGMYLKYGGKTVEEVDKKEVLAEFKTFKIFYGSWLGLYKYGSYNFSSRYGNSIYCIYVIY